MKSALVLFAGMVFAAPAFAEGLPMQVGQCVETKVVKVETRLEDGATHAPMKGSGSAIRFANGGYQVSYDQVDAVDRSRPGDRVRLCLVALPNDCPPGDDRGKMYKTTNLRTHLFWTLPDSEHSCGGA